ncbi:poly [ADP-ribose] polymerase tankyrase-1-like [Dromiciops gliroides]|uniref:poly [ADP-ribose] polymerase tankyrase-1-like n=1 Tax=Dromiciops gliroides TaxID=33562 RepID=UPI001CC6E91F|nr:poly [ADP-ribose] polymerase tankyrase-1-like [Dromiciops gliroides]
MFCNFGKFLPLSFPPSGFPRPPPLPALSPGPAQSGAPPPLPLPLRLLPLAAPPPALRISSSQGVSLGDPPARPRRPPRRASRCPLAACRTQLLRPCRRGAGALRLVSFFSGATAPPSPALLSPCPRGSEAPATERNPTPRWAVAADRIPAASAISSAPRPPAVSEASHCPLGPRLGRRGKGLGTGQVSYRHSGDLGIRLVQRAEAAGEWVSINIKPGKRAVREAEEAPGARGAWWCVRGVPEVRASVWSGRGQPRGAAVSLSP